ncbi:unnamed protein product [Penicillium salamii]|uniref:RING-type E3 ubiquitin transferase n=1 Tax=Penicillium salamii TaxID=1612424 RepID=A0A9W4NHF5_9EURO|nr:unnamed protein product [Penicillium salamii]CAG8300365.1 unnamed protein product [Penicillium salamii]CAG8349503.1 unnamed protein product [Penicillium salamii]CAG8370402.1 unnamed protein product [Penicillium salamii]CAG8371831.1 unnamed protein product [Penicillium salamii]
MLPLFLLLVLSTLSVADVVALPSNLTHYPSLHILGSPLNGTGVLPLTTGLRSSNPHLNISGTATEVTSGNSLDLKSTEIALISCDSDFYTGNLGVDDTIEYVTSAQSAAAIILYSRSARSCNLTVDDTVKRYQNIFSVYSRSIDPLLQSTFNESHPSISIVPMSSFSVPTDSGGGGDSGGSGDSPNTAMIILYSITGIITALFLGIIITGAVRAHRHPERYGPRRIAGRVRQSRARGIARAMLDTIPVVKYDDKPDDVEAAKRDIELTSDDSTQPSPRGNGITEPTTPVSELPTPDGPERPTPTPEAKTETVPDAGNLSCPICTDDFVKGQDLRVLPCNHQFHMECIDPWLMNVSGTCPLCRIDLNPPQAETEQTEGAAGAADTETTEPAAAPTPETETTQTRHSRRLTDYLHGPLNARRMRDATVEERLAALRRVREANQSAGEEGRRTRLTTRLRERFRIRTRAHGEAEAEAEAPAAPAPVHMPPSNA